MQRDRTRVVSLLAILALRSAGHADDAAPVTVSGRVFARGELATTDAAPWTGELSLASARLTGSYRWTDRLRIKVGVEAADGDAKVRDAFVEIAAGAGIAIRSGRFKAPISAIERESAWRLPSIGRGAVADVLEDGLALTGRRDGVEVSWRDPADRVRVAATVSQSVGTTGDAGAGAAFALRGELAVTRGVRVGVVGSSREVDHVSAVGRYWAAGADVEVDIHGLRLWGDVLGGTSHLAAGARFVAAQAIAGWRLGGEKKGTRYVEPYAVAAYANPDLAHRDDELSDASVGVAAGHWKRWRVQVQLSVVTAGQDRPAGLGGHGEDIDDRTRASVQVGAAF